MAWDRTLQPDTWYLMRLEIAERLELPAQYQLRDRWLSVELVLVKTPEGFSE